MKLKMIFVTLILLGSVTIFAQNKTEKFKVYGNCGMCETRIENAVNSLKGVTETDWDKETKFITVTYISDEVTLSDINKAIAKVGHDTDSVTAENSVYDDLPNCCKYDRPAEKKSNKGHDGHQH